MTGGKLSYHCVTDKCLSYLVRDSLPDSHSPSAPFKALLNNNNISVPLALFGTTAADRVLVDQIRLLANVRWEEH